jgi:antigen flippase
MAGINPASSENDALSIVPDRPRAGRESGNAGASYDQILKSSALIGGASVVNIGIGVVRTKIMAMLLGPAGVGLLGLYGAIADLAQSIAGMGIINSGVRQIAEAAGSGHQDRIAATAAILRRTSVLLGLAGAAALMAVAGPVAAFSFGDDRNAGAIALLAIAVLCRVVSDGQAALLQGLRRIADLAKMGMLGALAGTLLSIVLVYGLGERGIVPSLVGVAATGIVASWWYSRKIPLPTPPALTAARIGKETAALLKLGFAFMASGLMMTGAAYAIRLMVLRQIGPEAAGLYQSAWGLGGMYVGLVLQAMGADFYPRLTAIAGDNRAANRLVNEQARVSLLLGGPGALATLVLAPWVIAVFYTARFEAAVEPLRWLCLGMTLRIVSWPMGFIVLAKGAQGYFFWSEAAWTLVYLGLAWICVGAFGVEGAGIAFFGSYIFHCLMIYGVVRRLSGFRWSAANRETTWLNLSLIAVVFCGFYRLPAAQALGLGLIAVMLSSVYSMQVLLDLLAEEGAIPPRLGKWLARLRLTAFGPGAQAAPKPVPAEGPRLTHTALSVFMIGAVFYMWAEWYDQFYEWQPMVKSWAPEPTILLEHIHQFLTIR